MLEDHRYDMVVIGTSAGGLHVIKTLLCPLPGEFSLPIVIVQHLAPASDSAWAGLLNNNCSINVKEAEEKEMAIPGNAYLAPANYHLLVEKDRSFTLTVDEHVNYARPSIDVLFETAADACRDHLIGIVMTGANTDGARGLRCIREKGGLTIVQDPETAEVRAMPEMAIQLAAPAFVLAPDAIRDLLLGVHRRQAGELSL